MSENLTEQIKGFWNSLKQQTSEKVAIGEASFARGQTAGSSVYDDAGQPVVLAGQVIDDGVLERAQAAGKLHAVVAAAMRAQVQDVKEQARTAYEASGDGREAANLETVDEYVEARRYVRWTAAIDVTDIRGNVLIPAGKEIDEDDVRLAREAGQLGALIYSAQQSGPPGVRAQAATPPPQEYRPAPTRPAPPRPTLPLLSPDEREE